MSRGSLLARRFSQISGSLPRAHQRIGSRARSEGSREPPWTARIATRRRPLSGKGGGHRFRRSGAAIAAAIQRADRHGAEPGPGPDRHRVPGRLQEAALQVEPAESGGDIPDPGPRVHPRGGARLGGQAGTAARRKPAPASGRQTAGAGTSTRPTTKSPASGAISTGRSTGTLVDVYLSATRDMAPRRSSAPPGRSPPSPSRSPLTDTTAIPRPLPTNSAPTSITAPVSIKTTCWNRITEG